MYLAEAMDAGDPALFGTYVAWTKTMLAARGIPPEDLAHHLELMRTVIAGQVASDVGGLAVEYVTAALVQLPSFSTDLPTCLASEGPYAELAGAYLGALLNSERHVASRMILDAVAGGVPVKQIYLHVFQPAQYEIGRLWQLNKINVAQEHYCTAATQLVMSQLYPYVFASEKRAGTLVATCVAGDLHEIGMRMVADFFEMEGWNTVYLGANMPSSAVVDTVVQRHAQALGISATMSFHLRAVGELIDKIHARAECLDVTVLVGGYPFLASPGLWRQIGADGTAPDAQAAIVLANQLIAHDTP